MDSTIQTALTIGMPTLAVLIGILVNNSGLSDLRAHMDSRFGDVDRRFASMNETMNVRFAEMKETMNARFGEVRADLRRVEEVMDARIKHLEER